MAGRVQNVAAQLTYVKRGAVGKQAVKLRAIPQEFAAVVEDLAEFCLDNCDLRPDTDLATKLVLNIGCCRQMVCVDMGFKNPLQSKLFAANKGDHGIGGPGVGATGGIIEIQHRIDNRAGAASRVGQDIGYRICRLIKKWR